MDYRINERPDWCGKDKEGVNCKQTLGLIIFTIRGMAEIRFVPEMIHTPFDLFDIPIRFELTSRTL